MCGNITLRSIRKNEKSGRIVRTDARLANVTEAEEDVTETSDLRCKRGSRVVVRLIEVTTLLCSVFKNSHDDTALVVMSYEIVHAIRMCVSKCTLCENEAAAVRAGDTIVEIRPLASVDHFNASAHSLSGARDKRCNIGGEDTSGEVTVIVEERVGMGTGSEADFKSSKRYKCCEHECKEHTDKTVCIMGSMAIKSNLVMVVSVLAM